MWGRKCLFHLITYSQSVIQGLGQELKAEPGDRNWDRDHRGLGFWACLAWLVQLVFLFFFLICFFVCFVLFVLWLSELPGQGWDCLQWAGPFKQIISQQNADIIYRSIQCDYFLHWGSYFPWLQFLSSRHRTIQETFFLSSFAIGDLPALLVIVSTHGCVVARKKICSGSSLWSTQVNLFIHWSQCHLSKDIILPAVLVSPCSNFSLQLSFSGLLKPVKIALSRQFLSFGFWYCPHWTQLSFPTITILPHLFPWFCFSFFHTWSHIHWPGMAGVTYDAIDDCISCINRAASLKNYGWSQPSPCDFWLRRILYTLLWERAMVTSPSTYVWP